MGISQRRVRLLSAIGLLATLCAAAGVFSITNSSNIGNLDVLAGIFANGSIVNGQIVIEGMAGDPVTPHYSLAASLSPMAPADPYIDKQWALDRINAAELWRVDSEVIVAILDTGIDKDHEDLRGVVVAEMNFVDSTTPSDINGHGTHIAGIIAANSNNDKGIAGLAPGACLMNLKVADDAGLCRSKDVARGIVWAVDMGAKVINISLEIVDPSEDVARAVEYAWGKGALVVAAAGNNGSDTPVYPAGYEHTLAVAALTMEDCLAPLSNYGEWVDVAAPGMNIFSLLPDDNYGYKTGTSFAAAHVSGVAAVLFSVAKDVNGNGHVNDEVRDAIEDSCDIIGTDKMGNLRLDAARALAAIN
jgi:thermitase